MAMSEAAKLFDSKQPSSGNKQDAVNGAAMTVMKLMVQSKLGSVMGGGNSGGLGGMMSLVSFKDLTDCRVNKHIRPPNLYEGHFKHWAWGSSSKSDNK